MSRFKGSENKPIVSLEILEWGSGMARKDVAGLAFCAAAVALLGCGREEHEYFSKPTTPVRGTVSVDGEPPGSPIVIRCHPVDGEDAEHPSITQGLTDNEGNFQLSTFVAGDGAPPGNYAMTFYWGKYNAISAGFAGPDRLKNRYSKPDKTPIHLVVTADEPIDMGTLELKTK
ncbi:MAG: hypothetical protein ACIALR_00680 [Blastopirellula sp. JB062]